MTAALAFAGARASEIRVGDRLVVRFDGETVLATVTCVLRDRSRLAGVRAWLQVVGSGRRLELSLSRFDTVTRVSR